MKKLIKATLLAVAFFATVALMWFFMMGEFLDTAICITTTFAAGLCGAVYYILLAALEQQAKDLPEWRKTGNGLPEYKAPPPPPSASEVQRRYKMWSYVVTVYDPLHKTTSTFTNDRLVGVAEWAEMMAWEFPKAKITICVKDTDTPFYTIEPQLNANS